MTISSELNQRGFTLIEVMAALAILSVVAIVASQTSGTYIRAVNTLKTRTLAHFVAQNTAANLVINKTAINSPLVSSVSAQGRQWQVTTTPTTLGATDNTASNKESPADTPAMYASLNRLQPVHIEVATMDDNPDNQSNTANVRPIIDTTMLLLRPVSN